MAIGWGIARKKIEELRAASERKQRDEEGIINNARQEAARILARAREETEQEKRALQLEGEARVQLA
ncbi:MAG: hypothetical protein MUF54_03675, partial [Polyangiaceae bacterium]|nr:hypothetical protein [Polyangiaceae bacterium]